MKTKIARLIVLAALGSASAVATAQQATDTDLQAARDQPSPAPAASPEASVPELSQLDEAFKKTSLGKEADELRLRVEWRELANRVANDTDIVAAKQSARAAHTDLEKRDRLRVYYELYYGKMRALAGNSELKSYLDQAKQAHLNLLSQARVRPVAGVTPTPFPQRKHSKK